VLDGESRVADSYARAPYHYLPLIRRDHDLPLLTMVNSSGGILGGDALEARIELDAHAAVVLRQQAATRVYRSEGPPARSRCDFVLGTGAWLDYFPDEIIPFAGSEYEQTTRVELAPHAAMLFGELVTAGRLARGERFAFTRLTLDVQCAAANTLLLRDRAVLDPACQPLENPAILGPATLWAAFYLFTSVPVDAALVEEVDAILAAAGEGGGGASTAPSGIVGRVVGTSLETVRAAFRQARHRVVERFRVGEPE
jgi:urease accessory protein